MSLIPVACVIATIIGSYWTTDEVGPVSALGVPQLCLRTGRRGSDRDKRRSRAAGGRRSGPLTAAPGTRGQSQQWKCPDAGGRPGRVIRASNQIQSPVPMFSSEAGWTSKAELQRTDFDRRDFDYQARDPKAPTARRGGGEAAANGKGGLKH